MTTTNTFYYLRSDYTGQVYKMATLPRFMKGWTFVTEEDYLAYCKQYGMKPL